MALKGNGDNIKQRLTLLNIYELLEEFGGNPEFTNYNTAIVADTICHNLPSYGSHKLYYYDNTKLFNCYTNCDVFDIFELYIKVKKEQEDIEVSLPAAISYIANRFGIEVEQEKFSVSLDDWKILNNYNRIKEIELSNSEVSLEILDKDILNRFQDKIIRPWLDEGILQSVIEKNYIKYYPGDRQIVIPHFDEEDRLIGIRGRSIVMEDVEKFGKYRPIKIGKKMFNHPLSYNLYNLNNSKGNIKKFGKAIVGESEKFCMMYQSYFGFNNDISVATCGRTISTYQINLLIKYGAKEICIAFDKDFEEIGDDNFKRLKNSLIKINNKYSNLVRISFLFDKWDLLGYKDSPIDCGKDKFLTLFKKRILLD